MSEFARESLEYAIAAELEMSAFTIVPSVISLDSMLVPSVVWSAPPLKVSPVPVKSVIVSLLTLMPELNVARPVTDSVESSVSAPVKRPVPETSSLYEGAVVPMPMRSLEESTKSVR